MIADELECLLQIFKARFVSAFLQVCQSDSKICFSETTPFAVLAKMLQGALSVVARNWVFTDVAVDASQRGIYLTVVWFRVIFRGLEQSAFEDRDGLGMIVVIVVTQ